jgi:hypothetical protein
MRTKPFLQQSRQSRSSIISKTKQVTVFVNIHERTVQRFGSSIIWAMKEWHKSSVFKTAKLRINSRWPHRPLFYTLYFVAVKTHVFLHGKTHATLFNICVRCCMQKSVDLKVLNQQRKSVNLLNTTTN